VNAQYAPPSPWESWQLIAQNDGTFCMVSVQFTNVYLSFDGSSCTSPVGPGCGTVNTIYSTAGSCHGKEAFRFINQGNGYYSIQSDWQPNAYLRIDGTGLNSPQAPGGGNVNGQYYPTGQMQGGYEVYKITKTN